MPKHGKKYEEASKLIDKAAQYEVSEAIELVKKTATAKFDETVEVAFKLGVDPRQSDQMIRGAVVLPNGTGKTQTVLVFAKGEKAKEAEALYLAYQKAANTLSATQRTQKEEAIVAKEREAAELRKKYFGPEGEMAQKQEALIAPIQNRIYEAVKQISSQKGYDAVIDRASATSIIFASPRIDVSNEVLSKLGYSK